MSLLPLTVLAAIPDRYQESAYKRADAARVALRISEASAYTLTQSDLSFRAKLPRILRSLIFETGMQVTIFLNSQITKQKLPR